MASKIVLLFMLFIAQTYAKSPSVQVSVAKLHSPLEASTQVALKNFAQAYEVFLQSGSSKKKAISSFKKVIHAQLCLFRQVGREQESLLRSQILAKLLNTEEKVLANFKAEAMLAGEAVEIDFPQDCGVLP